MADQNQTELAPLPSEVWIMVFRYLGPFYLSRVRLTCRTWNQIVCGSRALMSNFYIQLDDKNVVESAEHVRELITGGGGGFTRVRFHGVSQVIPELVGASCVPFAENLHTLSIVNCKLPFSFVMQLLEQTTNLRIFFYWDWESPIDIEDVRCTFQLARLKHLRVILDRNESDATILRIFREMCTELEVLDIEPREKNVDSDREVLSFVKATRDTLKELTIHPGRKDLVEQLACIEGLNLRRLSLDVDMPMRELLPIVMAQVSHLECLTIDGFEYFDIRFYQDMCDAGVTFPKLKRFHVDMFADDTYLIDQNFLQIMPNLEALELENCDYNSLESKPPFLNELMITGGTLDDYFGNEFINVQKLHLSLNEMVLWDEMLDLVRLSGKIEELTLTDISFPELEVKLTEIDDELEDLDPETRGKLLNELNLNLEMISFETHGSSTLRVLDLHTNIPDQLLQTLIEVYPNLSELYLYYAPSSYTVYFKICRTLPQLKILRMCSCRKLVKGRVTESHGQCSELIVVTCERDDHRVRRLLRLFAENELRFVPCNYLKQNDSCFTQYGY